MSFSAAPHLAGLKDFQRRTVDHVISRFYGDPHDPERTGRFLVADETGLGKSIVARGVIARAVEHLEAAGRRHITVLYVCSNQDLARQNLRRINITGDRDAELDTRLSMLATRPELLSGGVPLTAAGRDGPTLNLIPLTPGTSLLRPSGAHRGGWQAERALLAVILEQLTAADEGRRQAGVALLHGTAELVNFARTVEAQRAAVARTPLDLRIVDAFARAVQGDILQEFITLRDELIEGRPEGTDDRDDSAAARERRWSLIGRLREALSQAGADVLEPDLIVLDEFQRFRRLLAPAEGDGGEDVELARTLFEHDSAKVLLLSATPYEAYTGAEDDVPHHEDFLTTVGFLQRHASAPRRRLQHRLTEFRTALTDGRPGDGRGPSPAEAAASVREALLPVMSRAERPPLAEQTDLVDVVHLEIDAPLPEDFSDWIVLRRMGDLVGSPVTADFWKSVPHFSTFMDGYQVGLRVRDRVADGDAPLTELLRQTTRISRDRVEQHRPLDLGHGNLRSMVEQTVEAGWWQMLWLPPSMPYTRPGWIYEPLAAQAPTKRLIFSAWQAVPTAVACLLSYEADRHIIEHLRRRLPGDQQDRTAITTYSGRLRWALRENGAPSAMNTLALFWPDARLARCGDPLPHRPGGPDPADGAGAPPSIDDHLRHTAQRLRTHVEADPHHHDGSGATTAGQVWEALFSVASEVPRHAGDSWLRRLGTQERDTSRNWAVHLEHLRDGDLPPRWHDDLPLLAAFSPGSIARRCMERIAEGASEETVQRAAWVLSLGLRNLFNRGETGRLLAALYGPPDPSRPFWRQVAEYCADGGLEAVLDEHLFQLAEDQATEVSDDRIIEVAQRAVTGMSLLPARYLGHDYTAEDPAVPFSARYALRYGGPHQSDASAAGTERQAEVRTSFNSPFPPFVLSTTSVGQEGIDFHWWCHRVVHWNLPSNPVDFEQREGRVNRFGGHAVRRNVAHRHGASVLSRDGSPESPWRRAFGEAEATPSDHGAFSPWWVYPGPARIQRVILAYPHSRERLRYERLRDLLARYRLTLGQPRQEDLVALMGEQAEHVTIDLSAPPS